MPRHPDMPCVGCGRLMYRTATSLPEGKARCRQCRRLSNPKPSRIQTWLCARCGAECSRIRVRGQVPKWCADCQYFRLRACGGCGQIKPLLPGCYCSSECGGRPPPRTYSVELVGPVPQVCPLPKPKRASKPLIWVMGWCQRCGNTFVIRDQLTNRHCSRVCAKADGRDRRRAVKAAAFIENVYRARIYERDKWRCQLCRKKVKRDAVVPHPKAPTLDHILPLSKGGTHEPANVQLACFMCNCIKSHGLYLGQPEQLRLLGA